MLEYTDFIYIAQDASVSEPTLRLWHHIYLWVEKHGYADTADTPEFVEYVCLFRNLTIGTINTHLRRMWENGLLSRNVLRRKLPPDILDVHLSPFALLLGAGGLPSSFVRYSLPGQKCSLEFKSVARSEEKMRSRFTEIRNSK